jgi:hypothetical protein
MELYFQAGKGPYEKISVEDLKNEKRNGMVVLVDHKLYLEEAPLSRKFPELVDVLKEYAKDNFEEGLFFSPVKNKHSDFLSELLFSSFGDNEERIYHVPHFNPDEICPERCEITPQKYFCFYIAENKNFISREYEFNSVYMMMQKDGSFEILSDKSNKAGDVSVLPYFYLPDENPKAENVLSFRFPFSFPFSGFFKISSKPDKTFDVTPLAYMEIYNK